MKNFCKKQNITEGQFLGKEKIDSDLDLSSLTSIPEGFNPTVGGYLDLSSLTSIPEGFNPTVGGYLDLRSLTSIPEGFNPTVGGYLDLRSLTSIPEGFNPTVGGYLYLSSDLKRKVKVNDFKESSLKWKDGKIIVVDSIMTEVIEKQLNISKVKIVGQRKESYLITDGKGNYAHGETIDEAKEDLFFKISKKDKSDYGKLTLSSVLRIEEAITCYRVITGACQSGTRHFLKTKLSNKKESYSVNEIISVTEGEYGNDTFKSFFKNKK